MTAASPRGPAGRGGARLALLAAMLLTLLGWSAGFALFTLHAMRPPAASPRAEGIVVLTGGAGRIEAALSLLAAGRARLMLISGVAPGLDLPALVRAGDLRLPHGRGLWPRVSLGHAATTTYGNAVETAAWARGNGLHSLIVVTAGYHMPRALAEIAAALPDATLYAYPVLPPALLRPNSLGTLRLLLSEYDKWLLVASGLAASMHLQEVT